MILKLKNLTNIYRIDVKKTRRERGYLALEDLRIKSKFPRSNMPICKVGEVGREKTREGEEIRGRMLGYEAWAGLNGSMAPSSALE